MFWRALQNRNMVFDLFIYMQKAKKMEVNIYG